jgi:small Trp-rich protein
MPLVIVGVLLLAAKMAEWGPFATWSWWIILAPFGLAVLWWHFADSSGWTKKREMNKMEQRKLDRREKAMEALGMGRRHAKMATQAKKAKAVSVSSDPTHAGRNAPSKPIDEADAARREPRL